MNAADKLYIIDELEMKTGYTFEYLRTLSDEKLQELYWERIVKQ